MIGTYEVIEADYSREHLLAPRHRGNPCIAALPLVGKSIEDIMASFEHLPAKPKKADRQLDLLERVGQLNTLNDVVIKLVDYQQAALAAISVLRETYYARNIITAEDRRRRMLLHNTPIGTRGQKRSYEDIVPQIVIPANWKSSAKGLGFFGVSGSGKTTFASTLGLQFMVVIRHTAYKGQSLKLDQIPWIYIQIPHDATVKSLCLEFFRTVDEILGYSRYLAEAKAVDGIAEMVMLIARVSTTVALGALFVDEFHNLKIAKGPNIVIVLNLFSQLVERAGISVFVAGTPSVKSILQPGTANQRKLITGGEVNFKLMALDSPEFDDFATQIWKYQYVKRPVRLTPAIKKAWHEASAGNPAFMVLAFHLAQRNEIGERECVDHLSLAMAASQNMATLQPAIRALSLGTAEAMQAYDDMDVSKKMQAIRDMLGLPPLNADAYAVGDEDDFPELVDKPGSQKPAKAPAARGRRVATGKEPDPLPKPENPLQ